MRTFDPSNRPESETRVIGFEDDDPNRPPGDPADLVTTWTYDPEDPHGGPLTQSDPLGNVTRFTYSPTSGQLEAVIDPLGNSTRYFYSDSSGFGPPGFQQADLVMTVDALNTATAFRYEAGNVTEVVTGIPFNNFTWYDAVNDDYLSENYDPDADEGDPASQPLTRPEYPKTTSQYDDFGDLVATTDSRGVTRTSTYDSNGNQDGTQFVWTNPLDPQDVRTVTTTNVYDPADRLVQTITPTGTTSTEYDDLNRPFLTTDRFGGVTETRYDARGSTIETISPLGLITRTVYDEKGRAVWTTDSHLPGQAPSGTRTYYDKIDRVFRTERYHNVVITAEEDPLVPGAQRAVFVSSDSVPFATSETVYDDAGRVRDSTDADGHLVSFEYDAAGRRTAVIGIVPVAGVVGGATRRSELEYDAVGRTVVVRDPLGRETRYFRDAAGNAIRTVFADGTVAETEYEQGRVTGETAQYDPADTQTPHLTTEFEHDPHGQLTAVILPAVPDPEDLDASGNPRLVRPRYEYEYDQYGNHTVIRDKVRQYPDGTVDRSDAREMRFTFDEHGRQLTRTLPEGQTEEFRYDEFGRQFLHVDFEGRVEQHVFEDTPTGQGRLVAERFFDNLTQYADGQGTATEIVSLAYDSEGRLQQQTDARGVTRWEYDGEGRTRRIESPEGAVNYEHDEATGRITRVFTGTSGTYAGDQTDPETDVRYLHDELGRLQEAQVWRRNGVAVDADGDPGNGQQPEATRYGFDLMGNLVRADLPNGIIAQYQHNDLNRLDLLTYFAPDGTPEDLSNNAKLAEFAYTTRPDGKRTRETQTRWEPGNPEPIAQLQFDWEYDGAGHLTEEVFTDIGNLLPELDNYRATYTHDLVGNRLEKSVDLGNNDSIDQVFASLYDANDRLLSEDADSDGNGIVDRATTYDWGGAGHPATTQTGKTVENVASDGTRRLVEQTTWSYSLQGRMASALTTTFDATGSNVIRRTTAEFEYGHDGIRGVARHRVEVDDDSNPGTPLVIESHTETTYLADPRNHTGYSQTIEETVVDLLTGQQVRKTVYTIGLDVIAQTVFAPGGPAEGETHILLYDGHGSTRFLADLAAAIAQAYTFDAYGNALGFDPATALTSLLYSGEAFDTRIGQQYLRARWYDHATGRFNRLDPFAGDPHAPQSLHKYLYAHADPLTFIDPSGQFGMIGALIASGGISPFLRATKATYSLGAKTYLTRTVVSLALSAIIQLYAWHYLPPLSRELRGLAGDIAAFAPAVVGHITEAAEAVDAAYVAITYGNIARVGLAFALAPFPNLRRLVTAFSVITGAAQLFSYLGAAEAKLNSISRAATALGFPLCVEINYTEFGGLMHTLLKVLTFGLDPAEQVRAMRNIVADVRQGNLQQAGVRFNALVQDLRAAYGSLLRIRFAPCGP